MNFTSMIKFETDKKYKEMLNNTIGAPFCDLPKILEQITYSDKRDGYYKRLNSEKEDFNNAISRVNNNRKMRLEREKMRLEREKENAELRARHRYRCWKIVKTIIFLIPIAFDVFRLYEFITKKNKPWHYEDLGYSFYLISCIASYACTYYLIKGLHKDEHFKNGVKRYNVFAIMVLVYLVGIIYLLYVAN